MRAIVVIILNVTFNYSPKLPMGKNDKVVKAFFTNSADKTLDIGVHIRGIGHNADFEIVFAIWELL